MSRFCVFVSPMSDDNAREVIGIEDTLDEALGLAKREAARRQVTMYVARIRYAVIPNTAVAVVPEPDCPFHAEG